MKYKQFMKEWVNKVWVKIGFGSGLCKNSLPRNKSEILKVWKHSFEKPATVVRKMDFTKNSYIKKKLFLLLRETRVFLLF